jgi:hypothetical protein
MRQSVRLGRIAGILIGMHWTVVVIAALITDMLAAGWLPAVIPHEPLASAVTASHAGHR